MLVTNVKNGKSVEVKINDRGPFVKGRIIDLTRSAFSKIGDLDLGVIEVKIKAIKETRFNKGGQKDAVKSKL